MKQEVERLESAGSLLAKDLAERGYRLFKRKEAFNIAKQLGYSTSYSEKIVLHLHRGGWIESVRPGLYALNPIFLGSNPIHEFEIATQMVKEAVVSHFSAFHHHGLTDQIPQTIYATVPTGTTVPRLKKGEEIVVWGLRYHYTQIKPPQFFGHTKIWIGDVKVSITDLERTLLDGLIKTGNCGGIQEVLSAFKRNIDKANIQTLIEYALKLDTSVAKRLGWVLDNLKIDENELKPLLMKEFHGYAPLDASGVRSGTYNKKWQIQENI